MTPLPPGCSLRSRLDTQEHLPLHNEAARLEDDAIKEGVPRRRIVVGVKSLDQPGGALVHGLDVKGPGSGDIISGLDQVGGRPLPCVTVQHNHPARFNDHHGNGRNLRVQEDLITGLQILPLRMDPAGIVNVAAQQVLDPSVTVEAAAPLPYLRQPRPHLGHRRMNCDGVGCRQPRVGQQLVAGKRTSDLRLRRTPANVPRPQPVPISSKGDRPHDEQSSESQECPDQPV